MSLDVWAGHLPPQEPRQTGIRPLQHSARPGQVSGHGFSGSVMMRASPGKNPRITVSSVASAALCAWLGAATIAFGQSGGCALIPDERNASEKVLRCGSGLNIRSAAGTKYQLIGQESRPTGARLDSGALLIEFEPGQGRRNFQILTPHAIAAVRGTKWAVDVASTRTSTLVLSGRVKVTRRVGTQSATLAAGQGVDVGTETGPLTVKHWPQERVRALLARFGE
jgi:ferric-dicitrate binding protein FerR (iron transport regulator)